MISPFSRAKFEESSSHIYFLPPNITTALETCRSTVMFGSRGSGKTTLLRALDWKERSENSLLKQQLGGNSFRGRFIGVYTKLSLHACKSLEQLYATGTALEGYLFGFYLDLLSIELIATAVSNVFSRGHLSKAPAGLEEEIAASFDSAWPQPLQWAGAKKCRTVRDVALAASDIRKELERWAQLARPASELAKAFRVPGFGEFSRSVSGRLGDLCNQSAIDAAFAPNDLDEPWHFKVCFDEAEVLSRHQQLVINTLIRLAEAPLLLTVSYVSRPVDLSQTLVPGLTLQKADFQQIHLDGLKPSAFKEFSEGVATVRCRQSLADTDVRFDSTLTLGEMSLNRLVEAMVSESEKTEASELRKLAQMFRDTWKDIDTSKTDEPLPYIEAFLANKLNLRPPSGAYKAERRQSSEQFRKKFVVAYLAICDVLGRRNVPFASAEMVLGVSDRCIRDFLHQLNNLFIGAYPNHSEEDLRAFLVHTIPWKTQDSAIRKTSEEKRDSIPRSGVLRPVQIGRLVKGLAQMTALLQCQTPDERNSGFVERGIFRLVGGSDDERREASHLVRDAAEAGFLRLVNDEADPLDGFRVHTSLAPAFGFSYRGAYYATVLNASVFHEILGCTDDDKLRSLADSLAAGPPDDNESQLLLFGTDEATDDKP